MIPDRCLETVAAFEPCLMTIGAPDTPQGYFAAEAVKSLGEIIDTFDAIAVGPGMRDGPGTREIVKRLAKYENTPRVFDADAINVIARSLTYCPSGPVILTPHAGELQRLTGASLSDRNEQIDSASEFARRRGVIVVLKGAATLVTDGEQRWFNTTGNPGMATAGSGDVLTGIILALLALRLSPFEAASLGVWIHGSAGDLAAEQHGHAGMIASDILAHLPAAVRLVTTNPS